MNIIIPESLQIVLDDVGWRNGRDDREYGGPSRTGICRSHVPDDYRAIDELGRLLDMKINCAFVIGEWDPDNRLSVIPYLSKYGSSWNNAAFVDHGEMREIAEIINNSPYIDIAIHGLMHGYYKEGNESYDSSDYYYIKNGEFIMNDEREIRDRLDAYLGILRHYGIKKEINSFVPPSFTYRWEELSGIVADYGVDFITTIFKKTVTSGDKPEALGIENGIVTLDRNINIIPWDEIGTNFENLPVKTGIFGAHWPNILAADPKDNGETVKRAAAYFRRCSEEFGVILSKDLRFAATQTMYKKHANVSLDGTMTVIDISDVPKSESLDRAFYVSSREPIGTCIGGACELYEAKSGFLNYKVTPTDVRVIVG